MDYFFCARTGIFSTALPEDGPRGIAELDPAIFTVVRSSSREWAERLAALRGGRLKLKKAGLWIKLNLHADAELADAPEEEWVSGQRWTNVRTGRVYESEDDFWADARDGDKGLVVKSRAAGARGMGFVVTDAGKREALARSGLTAEEVQAWRF